MATPPNDYDGRYSSHASAGSSPGRSPGLFGTSPPTRTPSFERHTPHAAAKKWIKRLRYDEGLNQSEFLVGYLESTQQTERRSGAEAWSLRVQNHLVEVTYLEFLDRFELDDLPFHRIAYFKHKHSVVWESDYFRKCRLEAISESPRLPCQSMTSRPWATGDDLADPASEFEQGSLVSGIANLTVLSASYADLPEECWMSVLRCLTVKELCIVSRVSCWLKKLVAAHDLWQRQYGSIFGADAPQDWPTGILRRACRRSELQAARWLDADVHAVSMGFANTTCLQVDNDKVVSADGSVLRLWSHDTGRRIATLKGQPGRILCVAFDDEQLLSGCSGSALRVWGMDDLKLRRALRGHAGAVTACALVHGLAVSGGDDGMVCLWQGGASTTPILRLEAGASVHALQGDAVRGYLVAAGWGVDIWDLSTAQKLHTLSDPNDADVAAELDEFDPLYGDMDGVPARYSGGTSAGGQGPFTCVSYTGNLLAAGCRGSVFLWDPRCGEVVETWRQAGSCSGGGDDGAWASSSSRGPAACAGVQLDGWKLLTAFQDGSCAVRVYDIRAAGGAKRTPGGSWPGSQPVTELRAPSRINCFQFREQTLVAGQELNDCIVWTFEPPGTAADCGSAVGSSPQPASGLAEALADLQYSKSPPSAGLDKDKTKKKKAGRPVKKQSRYPKRSTK